MNILDVALKWMDMDGSQNFANGYGWIWMQNNIVEDTDGYGLPDFLLLLMDMS